MYGCEKKCNFGARLLVYVVWGSGEWHVRLGIDPTQDLARKLAEDVGLDFSDEFAHSNAHTHCTVATTLPGHLRL